MPRRSSRAFGGWLIRLPALLFLLLAALWLPMFSLSASTTNFVVDVQTVYELPLRPDLVPLGDKNPVPPSTGIRRAFVSAAQSLVGKVGYFWGGKSASVGWDPRWGTLTPVLAPGGPEDPQEALPYGLDCSGLVSWSAVTAIGTADAYTEVGDGVRAQYAACTPVDWGDIQAGDLLFFPDLSHVGIAAGDAGDAVPVIHASYTLGGVVLSQDAAEIGFTLVGVPTVFDPCTPFVN